MEWRGAALEAQSITAPEWMISGPSETGKTVAALYRLDRIARQNPGARIAIIRKVRNVDIHSVDDLKREVVKLKQSGAAGAAIFVEGPNGPRWLDVDLLQ